MNSSVRKPSKYFGLVADRFFVTLCAIVAGEEEFLLENCHWQIDSGQIPSCRKSKTTKRQKQ